MKARNILFSLLVALSLLLDTYGVLSLASDFPRQIATGSNFGLIQMTREGDVIYIDQIDFQKIYVYNIETGEKSEIGLEDDSLFIVEVRANDYGQIVFSATRHYGAPTFVFLWDRAGGTRRIAEAILTGDNYGEAHPRINNFGEILFRSEASGKPQLFLFSPHTGTISRLTRTDFSFEFPTFNSAGEIVVRGYDFPGESGTCKLFALSFAPDCNVLREIAGNVDRYWTTVTELNEIGLAVFTSDQNELFSCDIRAFAPVPQKLSLPQNGKFNIAMNNRYLAHPVQEQSGSTLVYMRDLRAGTLRKLGATGDECQNKYPAVNDLGDAACVSWSFDSMEWPRVLLFRSGRLIDAGEGSFVKINDEYIAWKSSDGIRVDKIDRLVNRGKKALPAINLLLLGE